MQNSRQLSVAVLVDLPRRPDAGGHVKCWERMAEAAAKADLDLDLTVYFSGLEKTEALNSKTRFRHLPPIFSTERLKFLPYVPDHTDLASYHRVLARELVHYDLLHTTDGFFAFAQTAARVSRERGIPLVTSTHTDTPSYSRVFTQQTLETIFKSMPNLKERLVSDWKLPERQEQSMLKKLKKHIQQCQYALVTRQQDHLMAEAILGKSRVRHLRLGVDKSVFKFTINDRASIEREYKIPPGKIILLFVGRVDVGKNIYTLANAIAECIKQGVPLHLIVAGMGPAREDVLKILGPNVTAPGYVDPPELAKLYASVDGLSLSSEIEIRSMAGVEAIASGCPVLVSEASGISHLFNNTEAMMVVPSGIENWVKAILEFSLNSERRLMMRSAAQKYSQEYLAGWHSIFKDDVFAVWKEASIQKSGRTV